MIKTTKLTEKSENEFLRSRLADLLSVTSDQIPLEVNFEDVFKSIIPDRADWKVEKLNWPKEEAIMCFADGSRKYGLSHRVLESTAKF